MTITQSVARRGETYVVTYSDGSESLFIHRNVHTDLVLRKLTLRKSLDLESGELCSFILGETSSIGEIGLPTSDETSVSIKVGDAQAQATLLIYAAEKPNAPVSELNLSLNLTGVDALASELASATPEAVIILRLPAGSFWDKANYANDSTCYSPFFFVAPSADPRALNPQLVKAPQEWKFNVAEIEIWPTGSYPAVDPNRANIVKPILITNPVAIHFSADQDHPLKGVFLNSVAHVTAMLERSIWGIIVVLICILASIWMIHF